MATKPVRLPASARWSKPGRQVASKGAILQPSAAVRAWFQAELEKLTESMTRETTRELSALFRSPAAASMAMDASLFERIMAEEGISAKAKKKLEDTTGSIVSQSRILLAALAARFGAQFLKRAKELAEQMVKKQSRAGAAALKASLKKATGARVRLANSRKVEEIAKASALEAANLIQRVPQQYLSSVADATMRSITSGKGSSELLAELAKQNVKVKNWAWNTARDQSNKTFANINRERMQDIGIDEFEWVHSGGSNQPREYHMRRAPLGLNGGIFKISAPPVIDLRTGERGLPGTAVNCNCKMRPILRFNKA
ncbi:MAG: hypothetical protein LBJ59_02620 [Zoogloeaceae bacterium]|jgi:uncharacterized protein with gpF-like domain|nr:hypothetical protein [Zoogloeaceae bacterium]